MIQSNYTKILSIIVSHSYFENSDDQILIFKPKAVTQELLIRYSLKLLRTHNGLQIYAPNQKPINVLLDDITQSSEITFLGFNIIAKDSNFYNYTELPLDITGVLFYSSDDELNQFDSESITLNPRIVDDPKEGILGELKISFNAIKKTLNKNFQLDFAIRFNARSTLWQYYIRDNSRLHDENMLVKSSSDIPFSDPIEVDLANGRKALLITSEVPIPLSYIPKLKFTLIKSKNGNNIILKELPNPNPKHILLTEIDGEKAVCSPIYFYI